MQEHKQTAASILSSIAPESVTKTYRGSTGCMCGCKGSYKETRRAALGAIKTLREACEDGEDVEVLSSTDGGKIISLEKNERLVVLWARA
jgi:hypothetical protein